MIKPERQLIRLQYFKCFALLLLSLLLAQFTIWREKDEFWLNSGGYPIWLRHCIKTVYNPYLLFVIVAAIGLSWSVVRQFFKRLRFHGYEIILVFAWVVIFTCLALDAGR